MCGIVACIHADPTSQDCINDLHDALYLLQHRGQDAVGAAVCGKGGRIFSCKGNGMAQAVFKNGERLSDLPGFMGVAHLRYPTAGTSANSEAQPFFSSAPGIAFSHNGNLINAPELRKFLDEDAHRHINTDSDSELMLNVFANELYRTGKARMTSEDCFAALKRTYAKCRGSWACVAMLAGFGIIAFRDSWGIRPLCLGSRKAEGQGTDYMLASESVALNFFGSRASDIIDILPGQAVIIEKGGKGPEFSHIEPMKAYKPDIFEYVYFARPDSVIDGLSVYKTRRAMGESLAKTVEKQLGKEILSQIDAVMPIPSTAETAARVVAQYLNKDLVGYVKNRYIFRTFIMPTQRLRRTGVRRKLSPIQAEFEGKNLLLVDDSIVRGTTSREIVLMAREAGAKKVYFASCAPEITHPHIYGIDLASSSELIAFDKTNEEIAKDIGADDVIFQSLEDLVASCASLSPRKNQEFEVGVFNGKYCTPVDEGYIEHLDKVRNKRKEKKEAQEVKHAILNGTGPPSELKEIARLAGAKRTREDMEITEEGMRTPMIVNSQDISLHNFNDYEK